MSATPTTYHNKPYSQIYSLQDPRFYFPSSDSGSIIYFSDVYKRWTGSDTTNFNWNDVTNTLTATNFSGSLSGAAEFVKVAVSSTNSSFGLVFATASTSASLLNDGGITYNPSTNSFIVTNGSITGTNSTISGTTITASSSFSGPGTNLSGTGSSFTSGNSSLVGTTSVSTNTSFFIPFVPLSTTQTGGQVLGTNAGLSYNPSTDTLTTTEFIGSLTGSATLIDTTQTGTNSSFFIPFVPLVSTQSSGQALGTDGGLTYNPSINSLEVVNGSITALNFIGSLTGSATLIDTTAVGTSASYFIPFVPLSTTQSSGQVLGTDAGISFNPSTNTLTVANVTGTASSVAITASSSNTNFNIPFMNGTSGNLSLLGEDVSSVIPLTYNPADEVLIGNFLQAQYLTLSQTLELEDIFTPVRIFAIQHASGTLGFLNNWSVLATPFEINGDGLGVYAYNLRVNSYTTSTAIELDSPLIIESVGNSTISSVATSSGSYNSFVTLTTPTSTVSGALITMKVRRCNPNSRIINVSVPFNREGAFGPVTGTATIDLNMTNLVISMTRNGSNFTNFCYVRPTLPLVFRYTATGAFLFFPGIQQPLFQLDLYFYPTHGSISGVVSEDTYVIKVLPTFTETLITGSISWSPANGSSGFDLNLDTVQNPVSGITYVTADPTPITLLAVTKSKDDNESSVSPYYLNAQFLNQVYESSFTSSSGRVESLCFEGDFTYYDVTINFTTTPTLFALLTIQLASSLGAASTTGYLGRASQLGATYASTVWATSSATICFLTAHTHTNIKFSISNPNSGRTSVITATNNGATASGVGTTDIPIISTGRHTVATAFPSLKWALSAGSESGSIIICGRNA